MEHEIKSITGAVLYTAEIPDDTSDHLSTRVAVEHAVKSCADLRCANLLGADLSGALIDANVRLVGRRPVLQIGPIGSRSDWMIAFVTDHGVRLRTGCFFGTVDQFRARLTNSDDMTREEYTAALGLVEAHARLWTPKELVSA